MELGNSTAMGDFPSALHPNPHENLWKNPDGNQP